MNYDSLNCYNNFLFETQKNVTLLTLNSTLKTVRIPGKPESPLHDLHSIMNHIDTYDYIELY